MTKWLDRFVNIYEYFIAFLFLQGAWNVARADAVSPALRYLVPLTCRIAIVIFAVMLAVLGDGLLVSKIAKQRLLNGRVLLGMYLLAFYIVTLSLLVSPWEDKFYLSIF